MTSENNTNTASFDHKSQISDKEGKLIEHFASLKSFKPSDTAFTIFLAGAFGIGKTEFAKNLLADDFYQDKPVKIDSKEIFDFFGEGKDFAIISPIKISYTWGVETLLGHCLNEKINCLIDDSFTQDRYLEDVNDSLSIGRKVIVIFFYQDPFALWSQIQSTKPTMNTIEAKKAFAKTFVISMQNAENAKQYFGDRVELDLILKDPIKNETEVQIDVKSISQYVSLPSSQEALYMKL